jgi:hypothetical protein
MKGKIAPRNTAQEVRDNPILGLITAMGEGGSGILAQEAQGQHLFVGSDTLPTEMGRYSDFDTKAILEAAGVKFLGPVEGDDMFQYVEFPQGWKKVVTDHSMWSKLVDDKGRVRASIFYKAAFYDRRAHMGLDRRYSVSEDYDRQKKEGVAIAHVKDIDNVIFSTEPVQLPAERNEKYYEITDAATQKAAEWLDAQYPDWKNPGAYWD